MTSNQPCCQIAKLVLEARKITQFSLHQMSSKINFYFKLPYDKFHSCFCYLFVGDISRGVTVQQLCNCSIIVCSQSIMQSCVSKTGICLKIITDVPTKNEIVTKKKLVGERNLLYLHLLPNLSATLWDHR